MRSLRIVLWMSAVVSMVIAIYAIPAMAQTPEEVRQAKNLIAMAERMGIEVPADPNERVRLAAEYGVTISPEAAAAADQPGAKGGNSKAEKKVEKQAEKRVEKELPKSGGGDVNLGLLLALGAGVTLIGVALVTHRSIARRRG